MSYEQQSARYPDMHSPRLRVALAIIVLAVIAACYDSPTSPQLADPIVVRAAASLVPRNQRGAAAHHLCYLSRRVDNRTYQYQYGRMKLTFPAYAESPDHSSHYFQVTFSKTGKLGNPADIVGMIRCSVPNTAAATEIMLQYVAMVEGKATFTETGATFVPAEAPPFIDDKRTPAYVVAAPRMAHLGIAYLPGVGIVAAPPSYGSSGSNNCGDVQAYCGGSFYDGGGPDDPGFPLPDGEDNPPVDAFDAVTDSVRPDCARTTDSKEQAWCAGALPTGLALTRLDSALARMHALGDVCDTLASIGDAILSQNGIRVVDNHVNPLGGAASDSLGVSAWIALGSYWFEYYYDNQHTTMITLDGRENERRSLQSTLAHELDHVKGQHGHVPGSNEEDTDHSIMCTDVYNPRSPYG